MINVGTNGCTFLIRSLSPYLQDSKSAVRLMNPPVTESFQMSLPGSDSVVSAAITTPGSPAMAYVFAHGAGAGMHHDFMQRLSVALAAESVAVLRFNFPYMESGRRSPDRHAVLIKTVRAAVEEARRRFGGLPLFAGGKSMGGRMTSQAQSADPLPGVRGLVFMGFPLHAAGKPDSDRAAHLQDIGLPMLFVQGTRDRLAEIGLMKALIRRLGPGRATLFEIEPGDHSLRVPKRTGRTNDEVIGDVARRTGTWMKQHAVDLQRL